MTKFSVAQIIIATLVWRGVGKLCAWYRRWQNSEGNKSVESSIFLHV